jgi:hypothetical protein
MIYNNLKLHGKIFMVIDWGKKRSLIGLIQQNPETPIPLSKHCQHLEELFAHGRPSQELVQALRQLKFNDTLRLWFFKNNTRITVANFNFPNHSMVRISSEHSRPYKYDRHGENKTDLKHAESLEIIDSLTILHNLISYPQKMRQLFQPASMQLGAEFENFFQDPLSLDSEFLNKSSAELLTKVLKVRATWELVKKLVKNIYVEAPKSSSPKLKDDCLQTRHLITEKKYRDALTKLKNLKLNAEFLQWLEQNQSLTNLENFQYPMLDQIIEETQQAEAANPEDPIQLAEADTLLDNEISGEILKSLMAVYNLLHYPEQMRALYGSAMTEIANHSEEFFGELIAGDVQTMEDLQGELSQLIRTTIQVDDAPQIDSAEKPKPSSSLDL